MTPVLGIIASSNQQGRGGGPISSYDALASVTLASATGTITFASIPTGYQHLQIRALARSANAVAADQTQLYFNGDASASNYTFHTLGGNGTSAFAEGYGIGVLGGITPVIRQPGASASAGIFGVTVIDILDYAKTNKNKTVRSMSGYDANGSGQINFTSGSWINTAAITSLTFIIQGGGNFTSGTTFALYGVK